MDKPWKGEPMKPRTEERPEGTHDGGQEDREGKKMKKQLWDMRTRQMEMAREKDALQNVCDRYRASRKWYRRLFQGAPVGQLVLSGQGLILETNDGCGPLFNIKPKDLLGRAFTRFIPAEDEDIFFFFRKRLIERPGRRDACRLRLIRSGGRTFIASLDGVLLKREGDGPDDALLIAVTDLSFAEDAPAPARDRGGEAPSVCPPSPEGNGPSPQEADSVADLSMEQAEERRLSSHLLAFRERDRRRLSLELHDTISQDLAVLKMRLTRLKERFGGRDAECDGEMDGVISHLSNIFENTRRISRELCPAIVEDLGLSVALGNLGKRFAAETGIGVTCDIGVEVDARFSTEAGLIVYRIFEEALENVLRHADAFRVSCESRVEADAIRFRIIDDGKPPGRRPSGDGAGVPSGFGISTMRAWAGLLSGDLQVRREPGNGVAVTLSIPVPKGGETIGPVQHRPDR